MANPNDVTPWGDDPDGQRPLNQPYAQEESEQGDDAPRRRGGTASARFIVESDVGADAALRDAMDPANQSLADALRLSYRVLQLVILVLVVLFLASGFQTVKDGESGVATLWGKIRAIDDDEALTPGFKFSLYPYPAAQFILFDVENLETNLGETFTPRFGPRTWRQALESGTHQQSLNPETEGSLITREGDLAHMNVSARYVIDRPAQFIQTVNNDNPYTSAGSIVKMALQRATVHTSAAMTLQELIDTTLSEETRSQIRQRAQEVLDSLDCGIQITQVSIDGFAPLKIVSTMESLQTARVNAAEVVETARKNANEQLHRVAGSGAPKLLSLIDSYEDALDRGDETAKEEFILAINSMLDSDQLEGAAASIIEDARAYQAYVEETLGNEWIRFNSLLPAFRANSRLVTRKQWLETYARATNRGDTEIFYVDPLTPVRILLAGSADVQDIRRKARIEQRKAAANQPVDPLSRVITGQEMSIGRPGRQLERGRDGLQGVGSNR